jgi:hypothetical protein
VSKFHGSATLSKRIVVCFAQRWEWGEAPCTVARCPSVGISVFEFSLMIREVTAKITSIADPKPDPHWFWSA